MNTARCIVNRLLESSTDADLRAAMQQATQELLADSANKVFGGGRPDGRPPQDGYDIGCGLCEEWANRVRELYQQATGRDDVEVLDPGNLSGDPDDSLAGHVFVRHGGMFYDAETPQGVSDWRQLPLFQRQHSAHKTEAQPEPDDFETELSQLMTAAAAAAEASEAESLVRFKKGACAYIRWAHTDPEMGQMFDPNDLRKIRRAKTLSAAIELFKPYDSTPSFLSMLRQGYFV